MPSFNCGSAPTRWHILGAGSMGTLWAARLARAGLPVTLILRNAARLHAYEAAHGLTLVEGVQTHLLPVTAQLSEADEPIERLLLTCKAYDAERAIAQIAHRLKPGADVALVSFVLVSLLDRRPAVVASVA